MVSNLLSIVLATVGWNIVWLLIEMTVPVEPRTVPVTNPEFQPDSDPKPEMKSDRIEMMRKPPGATLPTPAKDEDTENSNPSPAETKITEYRVQKIENDHLFYHAQIDQLKNKFQNLSSTIEGFEEMDQENRLLKEKVSTWVTTESELRRENSYLKAEIKKKDQELEMMTAEVDSINTTIAKRFFEKLDSYVDRVSPRISQLESEKSLLQSTLDDLRKSSRKRVEELIADNTQLRESIEVTAEKSKEEAENDVAALSEELASDETSIESASSSDLPDDELRDAGVVTEEEEPEQPVEKKRNRIAKWLEKHGFLKKKKPKPRDLY
jgi:uncharacterized phage infection (PIP) family protein YhgE